MQIAECQDFCIIEDLTVCKFGIDFVYYIPLYLFVHFWNDGAMFAIFYTLASGEMDMSTASATSATLKASKRNLNLSIDGGGRGGGIDSTQIIY